MPLITLPLGLLGLAGGTDVAISFIDAAKSAFIYLGIPLLAGVTTRATFPRAEERRW